MSAELERGRRMARRHMAWYSFWLLFGSSALIVLALVFAQDREGVAAALDTARPLLTSMLTVFTTIVLGYFGASVTERILKKEK